MHPHYSYIIPERRCKSIDDQKKRKTHTSNEVKARYNAKTYKRYALVLRKDSDQDIIEMIEAERAQGLGTGEAIKKLIRG